ncbi:serine/threonine-protein kinase [Actinokineospora terrae]|uniref:serine/threonine-protein kinase n=1 Tax=Actinokineospora terrae TaxID=155974 RepID=UPI001C435187|nr:serine/threonine-protein kinase [Actinokineospora terrae]
MSERGQTGRVVGGRFELLGRLGSGGMGTVWRARDVGLEREVAIKEMRPADAALFDHNPALAAQQRERVLRESRALARLQHPNVVSIYQIIESDDSPYPWIVMELVRGTSLDARLLEGTLGPAEAARIGRGVLGALRAAHAAGVLHRDVKPGNVLLRLDGSAVLTDFGIAALNDSGQLTATGEVIGSPEYIAPERLLGDETRTASDLWSLAMLLYVAVEGYHPMRRATTMATLAAVMTEPVPPPRRAGALGPVLSAVLVPDPNARPAAEVLDRMLAAAEQGAPLGPPTPARPVLPGPHTPPRPIPTGPHGPPTPARPVLSAPSTGPWQHQHPAYRLPDKVSQPIRKTARTRAIVGVVAAALVLTVTLVLIKVLNSDDTPANNGAAPEETSSQAITTTAGQKVTERTSQAAKTTTATTTTTAAAAGPEELLTTAGARKVVSAFSGVMGGSKVSSLYIYGKYAMATAPTAAVKNGFDDFEYRNGTAVRKGPDGVDADRAVVDLNKVNWDALPALWERANKELGVEKPSMRYIIVDTGLIDHVPALKLYVSDEYGGGYLLATIEGKVIRLYPR